MQALSVVCAGQYAPGGLTPVAITPHVAAASGRTRRSTRAGRACGFVAFPDAWCNTSRRRPSGHTSPPRSRRTRRTTPCRPCAAGSYGHGTVQYVLTPAFSPRRHPFHVHRRQAGTGDARSLGPLGHGTRAIRRDLGLQPRRPAAQVHPVAAGGAGGLVGLRRAIRRRRRSNVTCRPRRSRPTCPPRSSGRCRSPELPRCRLVEDARASPRRSRRSRPSRSCSSAGSGSLRSCNTRPPLPVHEPFQEQASFTPEEFATPPHAAAFIPRPCNRYRAYRSRPGAAVGR